jgi:diacylglycerol kinase
MNKFIKSLGFAIQGIKKTFQTEANFKTHLVMTVMVIISGVLLSNSSIEWAIILILIGLILSAELMNTAIELLADEVSESYNYRIKKVKDAMAGAVLVLSIVAIIIGLIIFTPKILNLIL